MEVKERNTELDALASLLDEPDENIYSRVKEKIFSYGSEAIPVLENAWDNSIDEKINTRITGIINEIHLETVFVELKNWKTNFPGNLLKGFLIVGKYHNPTLDEKKVVEKLGQIIQDVWLELNNRLTPLEKVKVINHILFDIHKFKANRSDILSPDNFFIDTLFEKKKGNPVSLGILYIIIAQSLKIPVYGVNLPQNFILAYTDKFYKTQKPAKRNVRFYMNAFNRGAVFTIREIDLFLKQANLKPDDSYYLPCDNITIIYRVLNTLCVSYENLGKTGRVKDIKKFLTALELEIRN